MQLLLQSACRASRINRLAVQGSNLRRLLEMYERWQHRLIPAMQFDDFLAAAEKIGNTMEWKVISAGRGVSITSPDTLPGQHRHSEVVGDRLEGSEDAAPCAAEGDEAPAHGGNQAAQGRSRGDAIHFRSRPLALAYQGWRQAVN